MNASAAGINNHFKRYPSLPHTNPNRPCRAGSRSSAFLYEVLLWEYHFRCGEIQKPYNPPRVQYLRHFEVTPPTSQVDIIMAISKVRRLCALSRSTQHSLRALRSFNSTSFALRPIYQINNTIGFATVVDTSFDETTDVLVVGAGAAGLVASLRAHEDGLKAIVIEKSEKIGGASSYSGGAVWIPNSHINARNGGRDSYDSALTYLNAIVGDAGPASSDERRRAFLDQAPKMATFLDNIGFKWVSGLGYPDYYPDKPGGSVEGRTIEAKHFNIKQLGSWRQHLLLNPLQPPMVVYCYQIRPLALMSTFKGAMLTLRSVLFGTLFPKLIGRDVHSNGRALVGRLLDLNLRRGIPIWRQTALKELIVENGAVAGAVVLRDGKPTRIRAKKGVLLAAGGFAKNKKMREKYLPAPVSTEWTSCPPGDNGDAVTAGMKVGAATALMDDAWWGPTFMTDEGIPSWCLYERSLPHGICVDSAGNRFMNESQSYTDCGHDQYNHNKKVAAIPMWLIVDARHRRRYPMHWWTPGYTPKSAIKSGFIHKASTLEVLAEEIGISPGNLSRTVKRFNEMARKGVDEDFGRGRTVYDNQYGDPRVKPNPNLGSLEKGPFYAIQLYPGDIGTKGGLLTDEHARVLREDGKPIPNLYAAGNTTATVMGRTYPGAGGTLGPALTFAYIAMNHVIGNGGKTLEK